jgi:hypothetical protein
MCSAAQLQPRQGCPRREHSVRKKHFVSLQGKGSSYMPSVALRHPFALRQSLVRRGLTSLAPVRGPSAALLEERGGKQQSVATPHRS